MWLFERKGELMLQLTDARSIAEIAKEWEGANVIRRESEEEGNITYNGFSRIKRIIRKDEYAPGIVEIVLTKTE